MDTHDRMAGCCIKKCGSLLHDTRVQLKLGYTPLGDPSHEAVVILPGTAGSGSGMLAAGSGGELFSPG